MRTALCMMAIACSAGEMPPLMSSVSVGYGSAKGPCEVTLPAEDVVYRVEWCDGDACSLASTAYRMGLEVWSDCQDYIRVDWWTDALVADVPCTNAISTEVTTGGNQSAWTTESCSGGVCRMHDAPSTGDGFEVDCDTADSIARVAWL